MPKPVFPRLKTYPAKSPEKKQPVISKFFVSRNSKSAEGASGTDAAAKKTPLADKTKRTPGRLLSSPFDRKRPGQASPGPRASPLPKRVRFDTSPSAAASKPAEEKPKEPPKPPKPPVELCSSTKSKLNQFLLGAKDDDVEAEVKQEPAKTEENNGEVQVTETTGQSGTSEEVPSSEQVTAAVETKVEKAGGLEPIPDQEEKKAEPCNDGGFQPIHNSEPETAEEATGEKIQEAQAVGEEGDLSQIIASSIRTVGAAEGETVEPMEIVREGGGQVQVQVQGMEQQEVPMEQGEPVVEEPMQEDIGENIPEESLAQTEEGAQVEEEAKEGKKKKPAKKGRKKGKKSESQKEKKDEGLSTTITKLRKSLGKSPEKKKDEKEEKEEEKKWWVKGTGYRKMTPLEQQVVYIKSEYPDALLVVECGYKYRLFGDDAVVAAKELGFVSYIDHNFMTCSFPNQRLFVHVRRLVAKGHKVGVVKQTETTALKAAGDKPRDLFTRELSALYTKSTMVGEDVNPILTTIEGEVDIATVAAPSTFLMAVCELPVQEPILANRGAIQIGIMAVQPSTGEIIYDGFVDNKARSELATRISHIQPVELLVPPKLSDETERLIAEITANSPREDDRMRLERIAHKAFNYQHAVDRVVEFYGEKTTEESKQEKTPKQETPKQETPKKGKKKAKKEGSPADTADEKETVLAQIFQLNFPQAVVCCLSALIIYLKDFGLQRALRITKNTQPFQKELEHMILNSTTLKNLEIFANQTDGNERGSLFWVLNHTRTKFGARKLKTWLGKPLLKLSEIEQRQEAVTEITQDRLEVLRKAEVMLGKLPDLERGLASIYHKKCSTAEFHSIVSALDKVAVELHGYQSIADNQLKSNLLKTILIEVPAFLDGTAKFLSLVKEKAAKLGMKNDLFEDWSQFPAVMKTKEEIDVVTAALRDHRREIRLTLKNPSQDYVMVGGVEFLVEVRNNLLELVPQDWTKVSATKTATRYHTPVAREMYTMLQRLREQLTLDCQQAWLNFVDTFCEHYYQYKNAVDHLATLDCLFSLANVAKQDGYCRPFFIDGGTLIHIQHGRHPVIDVLLDETDQFVPNSTQMDGDGKRCMVISGPNMGGKSSYIRQVALIVIMAQVGSYVPAESASLGIVDAVMSRMGASDDIAHGRSTFMVELQEAAEILNHATSRSLVILDELGRGTSTHDGVAIAYATLQHLVTEVKCLTLFVTHFPPLGELEALYPESMCNYHMAFLVINQGQEMVSDQPEDASKSEANKPKAPLPEVVTFLYQLVPSMAAHSYGLNVAQLANVPPSILQVAAVKSKELETVVQERRSEREQFRMMWNAEFVEAEVDEMMVEDGTMVSQEMAAAAPQQLEAVEVKIEEVKVEGMEVDPPAAQQQVGELVQQQAPEATEQQAEAMEQQDVATEQQAQATEEQVQATEQQALATEQQAVATEQQAQATEQQTQATEEQVQATEQQAVAIEQQAQATEQQATQQLAEGPPQVEDAPQVEEPPLVEEPHQAEEPQQAVEPPQADEAPQQQNEEPAQQQTADPPQLQAVPDQQEGDLDEQQIDDPAEPVGPPELEDETVQPSEQQVADPAEAQAEDVTVNTAEEENTVMQPLDLQTTVPSELVTTDSQEKKIAEPPALQAVDPSSTA
ncbi:DNA mismatch repair protein Msh3-like isoform X1 [Branchiostoma lanceolatum]|uniref:DNA mismatch repair protein Msh3-like isoform X1 n=1 Tax=Branchiostoma lanceolatum TaxID=7740 RepID=UPI0034560EA6